MLRRSRVWAILLLGVAFALGDGGYNINILDPATSNNREVSKLLWWVMGFAAVIFVVVIGAMTYIVLKFKKRGNEVGEPPQFHGNDRLEITWTLIPFLIVCVIFGLTARGMFEISQVPPDAMPVKVTAHLFWWDFEYPEQGIRTSNELILPVNRPVNFEITSNEAGPAKPVIHSFRVASLAGTQDAIPGIVTTRWFKPEKEGVYYGQCAELCGASHSNMRFRVIVVSQAEFDRFVQGAKAFQATTPADPVAAKGQQLFNAQCTACHAINNTQYRSKIGPDLTFFGNRLTLGAGIWNNTPERLEAWIKNSPGMKPGSLMPPFPQLSAEDARSIAAYLESLKVEGLDFSKLPKF
ncbi:MAG: cytochrome c oxidase subunit II [Meiothermus silvanus]|nr:cytochrome c oxidase subunit II [Allomeiothermus silvanus]